VRVEAINHLQPPDTYSWRLSISHWIPTSGFSRQTWQGPSPQGETCSMLSTMQGISVLFCSALLSSLHAS